MAQKPYDPVLKKFLNDHVKPRDRVLDVGCGTGYTALQITKKFQCAVYGVDINKLKVHRANAAFVKAKKDHLVVCHVVSALQLTKQFAKSSFDVVVSNHSIHHYDDVLKALREIRAVLKPKGVLLLGELEQSYGEQVDNCPRFSLRKIEELVKRANLDIVSVQIKPPGVILIEAVRL